MKKIFRSSQLRIALGVLLIAVGCGSWWLRDHAAYQNSMPVVPPSQQVVWKPVKPSTIEGNPVQIDIPSLHLSLPVINGYYNAHTQSWTLTNDKVQYAVMTPPPNNAAGNTFLYGHYRWNVFALLHTIKPGAQAIILTDNHHTFTYTFVSSRITNPVDDSIFSYQGPPILTIQTCHGLFFQDRQFFTFNLTKVQ